MLVLRLACVLASSAALAANRGFAQPPPADDRRARRLARVWPADAAVDVPAAPTWDELARRCGDAVEVPAAAADASVVFWRDAAHWCPYCQSVEIVLAERRIDHVVRCVPLRCYGEKPSEFVDIAGVDATLPVLIVDGRVYGSSRAAMRGRGGEAAGVVT